MIAMQIFAKVGKLGKILEKLSAAKLAKGSGQMESSGT